PLVRYADGGRQVVRWDVVAPAEPSPCAFLDDGVYLLTGGLGGVGRLVATAILTQTRHAVVIVTGRAPLTPDTQRRLDAIGAPAGRLIYRPLDLTDREAVVPLVTAIPREH